MAISEKQRQAARANGAKSRGPRTEAGRSISRRNALKHGMAGKGAVVPEDMARELEAERALHEARFRPRDDYERRLVETAALASVRWNRLARAELEWTAGRVRHAVADWDSERADEVAALAELLGSRPAEAVRRLMRTAEGCDYLADTWEELAEGLERNGSWDEAGVGRFLALLGMDRPPGPGGAAEKVAWYEAALALRAAGEPEGSRAAEVGEARELVLALAREQVEELVRLGDELWEGIDGPDRAAAPDRAMFDGGPEAARLARYMADAERTRRRALAELEAARQAEVRERREDQRPSPMRRDEGSELRRNEPGAGVLLARNEPGEGVGAGVLGEVKGAWEVPLAIGRAVGTPVSG